jgi:V8-like Glu-specific endopeptidase
MRRRSAVIATALLLLVAFATPASGISNGQLDDMGKYPYVGIVLVPALGGGYWGCSAAAIEPKKVLTAAHCIDDYATPGPEPAIVSFESDPTLPPDPTFPNDYKSGTIYPHPDWCIGCGPGLKGFDTHDVAVIVLEEALDLPGYADLPSVGLVDTLKKKTKVDIVGYGLQRVKGKAKLARTDARYYAVTRLIPSEHVHSDEFIKLSAGKGKDDMGGTCFGDSGGPNLEHDTDTILAVTSYGNNAICAGVGYSNRIDLRDILGFINNTN